MEARKVAKGEKLPSSASKNVGSGNSLFKIGHGSYTRSVSLDDGGYEGYNRKMGTQRWYVSSPIPLRSASGTLESKEGNEKRSLLEFQTNAARVL